MKKSMTSVLTRYALALGSFALVLLISFGVPRLTGINLDLTSLMILVMIGSAWYLGFGPGLVVALIFEAVLDYFSTAPFTSKSAFIIFNRLLLFVSLVAFASSRRKAEKQLLEQREWLHVSLSSIGDAVIATDINGFIKFINPTAETLTGWTSAQAVNKPLEEVFQIINEETREKADSPFAIVMREGNVVGLANHTNLIAKDGKEIPIENSGAPIKDSNGNIIGVIVVFHDVSKQREIENQRARLLQQEQIARSEAETANRDKNVFLATVSHELRTPLNAILGWSSILSSKSFEDKTINHAMQVIHRNAKSQTLIIDDLFDVSSILIGKFTLDRKEVNFIPIVQSAIDSLVHEASAKSITIKNALEVTNDLIYGDSIRLRQIVLNLISNAIKFTPAKGEIEVSLSEVGNNLELKVADNGIGIDKKFLPYVFEKFRQADASTTRSHGGLGLGLALVQQLTELHGGAVSADSDGDGKGAIFRVQFPLVT